MPGVPPRRPTGNSPQAKFSQFLYDTTTRELRLNQVSGQRTVNSTNGFTVFASRARQTGGGETTIATFKLRFVEDDCLVCREWDGATIGATDILVAKPPKLRCSLTSERVWATGPVFADNSYAYERYTSEPYMVYGTTVPDSDPASNEWGEVSADYDVAGPLYHLVLNVKRTETSDGIDSQQIVCPPWLKGDIIRAALLEEPETVQSTGFIVTEGDSIEYAMISESRIWARL